MTTDRLRKLTAVLESSGAQRRRLLELVRILEAEAEGIRVSGSRTRPEPGSKARARALAAASYGAHR